MFWLFVKYLPVLAQPLVIGTIINLIVDRIKNPDGDSSLLKIFLWVGFWVILIIQNVLTNYLYQVNYSKAQRSIESGLRSSIIRKLQQLSFSYHKHTPPGKLHSKIMNDVTRVSSFTSTVVNSISLLVFNFLFSVIIVISKSPIVFLFFCLTIPLAVIIRRGFNGKIKENNRKLRIEIEHTSSTVVEMLEMVPITKAHSIEDMEMDKANNRLHKVAAKSYNLDIVHSVFGSITWAAFMLFQAACLCFTGYMAYIGKIEVGDITIFQSYFSTIISCVQQVLNLVPVIASGFDAVDSIGDIMYANDIEDNDKKEKIKNVEGEFDFKDVSFKFEDGDHEVLNGLNLHVNKGETIALVGESGCGKTTILNLVIGFFGPTKGQVLIDGKDLFKCNLRSYREHISVVPQNSILFSGTIRENISYGLPEISDEKIWEAVRAANLEDFVKSLPEGLDTNVGVQGANLSGGQKQRISIARAVIRNPAVIIFDEATSALDSVSEKLVQDAIDSMCKNRTTFIVAHRLSTIRNADHIAFIENGKCVEYGTYEELMEKKGAFYNLKKLQS